MSFELPEFMSDDGQSTDPFKDAQSEEKKTIVFIAMEGVPVASGAPIERPKVPELSKEELFGLYLTVNAMMNILVERNIITESQLTQKVKEIRNSIGR